MSPAPRRASLLAFVLAASPACGDVVDPPGRVLDPAPAAATLKAPAPPSTDKPAADAAPSGKAEDEPGHGAKIGSIAMRTWIYVAPDDRSTKLGYLRAGAVVDRAERSAGDKNCDGGWYRIVPRGYVCVGKGATLSLDHQVVQAALRGPDRASTLPYSYVMSRSPAPHLYFRLPTATDQRRVEGPTVREHVRITAAPRDDPRHGARVPRRGPRPAETLRRQRAAPVHGARGPRQRGVRLRPHHRLRMDRPQVRPDDRARPHRARPHEARQDQRAPRRGRGQTRHPGHRDPARRDEARARRDERAHARGRHRALALRLGPHGKNHGRRARPLGDDRRRFGYPPRRWPSRARARGSRRLREAGEEVDRRLDQAAAPRGVRRHAAPSSRRSSRAAAAA